MPFSAISFYALRGCLAIFALLASFAFSSPKKAAAERPPNPSTAISLLPVLDTLTVRKLYLDGEFDQAIDILETSMREKSGFSHIDSVFIFKHLGVMYAAKYETREKGKYNMHQLLMVEPTARIMDMYASDMIYMIFKNIQDEFEATRRRPEPLSGKKDSNSQSSSWEKEHKSKGRGSALLWVGATGAVVAAGVTAYIILSDDPKTVDINHNVPTAKSQ